MFSTRRIRETQHWLKMRFPSRSSGMMSTNQNLKKTIGSKTYPKLTPNRLFLHFRDVAFNGRTAEDVHAYVTQR